MPLTRRLFLAGNDCQNHAELYVTFDFFSNFQPHYTADLPYSESIHQQWHRHHGCSLTEFGLVKYTQAILASQHPMVGDTTTLELGMNFHQFDLVTAQD